MQLKEIHEGAAALRIYAPKGAVSKDLPVFYNPIMRLNRDIGVLILSCLDKKGMQIADIMAGSGVRAVRLALELPAGRAGLIVANDASPDAVRLIEANLRLNSLAFKLIGENELADKPKAKGRKPAILVSNLDANMLLLKSRGFDYIDIDPFGYPGRFIDAAVSRLSRHGLLAVTATDTSALAGSQQAACMRKYWSSPLRGPLMHEVGLRILICFVQLQGARYDKALRPVFSYSKDHYMRAFFRCEKGKQRVDKLLSETGFISYCPECCSVSSFNSLESLAEGSTKTKGSETEGICDQSLNSCNCRGKKAFAGRLWLGKLWDRELIKGMIKMLSGVQGSIKGSNQSGSEDKDKKSSTIWDRGLKQFLELLLAESGVNTTGFYDMHAFCRAHSIQPLPKIETVITRLKKAGFRAARTHFSPIGIRSDAGVEEIMEVITSTRQQ